VEWSSKINCQILCNQKFCIFTVKNSFTEEIQKFCEQICQIWHMYVSVTYLYTKNHLPVCKWGRWFKGMRFVFIIVSQTCEISVSQSLRHLRVAARKSMLQLRLTWLHCKSNGLFCFKNTDRFYSVDRFFLSTFVSTYARTIAFFNNKDQTLLV